MKAEILAYVREKYHTEPEYLWERATDSAVLRQQHGRKWYAVIMPVARAKLGLVGEGRVWLIDVKATRDNIERIPYSPGFLPGYHMNKKHWISILLDGTVPAALICRYVAESYDLTR